jgi:RimJ/RimL family protein N-acetyltransferase
MNQRSIRTDRLRLRRWRNDDVEPFANMCSDPEVMRHIGSGATRISAQARTSIHAYEREWEENGFGLFAVERLEDGKFLGFTGLAEPSFLPEIMPAVEIGWRFARQSWGNGYASEAAKAALEFGLQKLGLPEIVGIYQAGNRASGRIMEKLGMRFDRETVDPSCGRLIRVHRTCLK